MIHGLIVFLLIYSLKYLALEWSSSVDAADFMEEILKYDCLYNELFSKDYKNKLGKMNCCRKVADKFSFWAHKMLKSFKENSPFAIICNHSDHVETV